MRSQLKDSFSALHRGVKSKKKRISGKRMHILFVFTFDTEKESLICEVYIRMCLPDILFFHS